MKPDKVDRFLVKKKERKAHLTSAQKDQVPNRSPSSEACSQQGPQYCSLNVSLTPPTFTRNHRTHCNISVTSALPYTLIHSTQSLKLVDLLQSLWSLFATDF